MFSLEITDGAAALIRKELQESAVKNPAVYLLEAKEGLPSAEELARMPLSDAQRRKVGQLAVKAAPVIHGGRRLVPCIYSKFHFFGLFVVQIAGITFLFPPGLKRKAAGGTLDVGQGALVLRDRTGRVVLPGQP